MTDLSAKTVIHGQTAFQEFQGAFFENYALNKLPHAKRSACGNTAVKLN